MVDPRTSSVKGKQLDIALINYVELVEIVRRSKVRKMQDQAFDEIERRMRPKIKQISYKFNIPGSTFSDVYQESLLALRYKAIKDYDKSRGNGTGPYPFDKFAILCIRRHLSTKLKACFQNKQRVMNSYISLDQERKESSGDALFLSDIVPQSDGTVLELLESNEYYKNLFTNLFSKLSSFEREVFLLYVQKYSYEQISEKINLKARQEKKKEKINVKSVDNALSRIKSKAKKVFDECGR